MATGGPGSSDKSFGPTQHDLKFDDYSGWVGVETDEESQIRDKKFPEDLKSVFGYRTVSAIPPKETQKHLPEFTGHYPDSQEKKGKATVRKISRLFSKAQSDKTVLPQPVKLPAKEFQPTLAPDIDFENCPVHVHFSDDELVKNMKLTGNVFTRPDSRPVFSGEPSPVDVQQTDQRSTCYMMSMLAAYAASPTGKKIIEAMVRPAGENLAMVTLYDPLTRENIQVMVSTCRLVDESGKDLYSFGNPTEARWAGIVEKAYHAYKMHRSKKVKEEIGKAEKNGELDRASYYTDQLHKVAPVDPKRSLLDWGDVLHSSACVPALPEIKDRPLADYQYQPNSPKKLDEFDLKGKKAIAELRYNIELGIPVTLGTPEITPRGIWRAISTGTPTNHAIAVLGPAEMMQHGKPVEGVLVYDQYGSSLDGGVEVNRDTPIVTTTRGFKKTAIVLPDPPVSETGDTEEIEDLAYEPELVTDDVINPVLTKAAGRSVRFYRYDELHKYFVKGSMARGCYS